MVGGEGGERKVLGGVDDVVVAVDVAVVVAVCAAVCVAACVAVGVAVGVGVVCAAVAVDAVGVVCTATPPTDACACDASPAAAPDAVLAVIEL